MGSAYVGFPVSRICNAVAGWAATAHACDIAGRRERRRFPGSHSRREPYRLAAMSSPNVSAGQKAECGDFPEAFT